jgi:mono/diheme cytochrome c family protein
MMNKSHLAFIALLILVVSSIAVGRKKPPRPEELGSELGKAPAVASSWKNPYAGDTGALLAGKKLFERHCAGCHGQDGRGRDKAPDLRSPVIQSASEGTLFWFLKNGNLKEGMPSWSRLPDPQKWQLVSYLKNLQTTRKDTPGLRQDPGSHAPPH